VKEVNTLKRNSWFAVFLSIVFPGSGHVYSGKRALGAAFMLAFIVIGSLNAIWLSIYSGTQMDMGFYGDTLPRILHDIFAFYGIVFWAWQAIDAYRLVQQAQ
jgi:hypothetical protein